MVLLFPLIALLVFGGVGIDKYLHTQKGDQWCLFGGTNVESRITVFCIGEKESHNEEIQVPLKDSPIEDSPQ
jgi:hypothetical protein